MEDLEQTRRALKDRGIALANEINISVTVADAAMIFDPRGTNPAARVIVVPRSPGVYSVFRFRRTEVNGGNAWIPDGTEGLNLDRAIERAQEYLL